MTPLDYIRLVLLIIGLVLWGTIPRDGTIFLLSLFVLWRLEHIISLPSKGLGKWFKSRRAKWELVLLPFTMGLLPFMIALLATDIFSRQRSDDYRAILVVIAAAVIHLGLVRLSRHSLTLAKLSGLALIIIVSVSTVRLIHTKHPYLNPFEPERKRLLAERVLSLQNNVVAESHVGYVFAYADELYGEGQLEEALRFYQQGLHLGPEHADVHLRVAEILERFGDESLSRQHREMAKNMRSGKRRTVFNIDADEDSLPLLPDPLPRDYSIVLVPMAGTHPELIQRAGNIMEESLGKSVYLYPKTIALPEADRKRGLATPPQIKSDTLHRAFWERNAGLSHVPLQVIVITAEDIYMEGSNFVFSTSYRDGTGVVSYARFVSADGDLMISRLAKQLLSCTIKSMGVPQANTLDCVTAYVRSLDQFDRRSINMLPQTRTRYEQAIIAFERSKRSY